MIKGFKGFNKNLQCTPGNKKFQYEIGKEYEEPTADVCDSGFHFCEYPLDVFSYYAPADSRYCEVEGDGTISRKDDDGGDSKVACSKLKIGAEIGIKGIIEASIKFIFDKVDFKNVAATNTGNCSAATNTGYCSAATNTGNCSAATNTGNCSAATNTGNCSAATVEGKESIAVCTGYKGKAKGSLSCWIALAEWDDDNEHIINFKSARVDGVNIKADTFYTLVKGEFVEAEK